MHKYRVNITWHGEKTTLTNIQAETHKEAIEWALLELDHDKDDIDEITYKKIG